MTPRSPSRRTTSLMLFAVCLGLMLWHQRPQSPGEKVLSNELEVEAAQKDLHNFMKTRDYECRDVMAVGNYHMCGDQDFRPPANHCLVYSFGIRHNWQFDKASDELFGCEVHSFDPSLGLEDHEYAPNIFFHNLGLSGSDYESDDGWQLRTLDSIVDLLSHEDRPIDALKVDIEGSEWPMLAQFLESGMAPQVRQLILEIHTPKSLVSYRKRVSGYPEGEMGAGDYERMKATFLRLERLGFRKYKADYSNNCCNRYSVLVSAKFNDLNGVDLCCYEIFYVNQKFRKSR